MPTDIREALTEIRVKLLQIDGELREVHRAFAELLQRITKAQME